MNLIDSEAKSYAAIVSGLADCDGVSLIHMWQLRDANGNERLGVNVAAEIQDELDRLGIGTIPKLAHQTQWDKVRLYLRKSHIGEVIEAASKLTDKSDRKLREAARCGDTMTKVRKLVA